MKKEFSFFKFQFNNMEQHILRLEQIADHSLSSPLPLPMIFTSVNIDLQI